MINRVNKVLIAKAISRTSSPVLSGSTQNAAVGEIFVLDKNKAILQAGSTISDTDAIYIAEMQSGTYNYVTETGTSVTGVKKYITSDLIVGDKVINYTGRAYSAIVEQVVTIVGSTFAPVVGTQYAIRVTYTDNYENPGLISRTYRVTATTTSAADLWTAFIAIINYHVS